MVPYFIISIVCFVALAKIRNFFKENGLGNRIDTGKVVLHSLIFAIFTIELVGEYVVSLLEEPLISFILVCVFVTCLIITDYIILYILWKLGTTVIDDKSSNNSSSDRDTTSQ